MSKLGTLFTHYNSLHNTTQCLQRLAAQTRQPDHIIIVNNANQQTHHNELERLLQNTLPPALQPRLHLLPSPSNLGNAGGCALGMDYAFGRLKLDYLWVLDDDSWPRPTSLATLINHAQAGKNIGISLVIDPQQSGELSWPLSAKNHNCPHWKHITQLCDLPEGDRICSRGAWLGALLPRHAWQTVGSPTPALFIRGEDEEYPWKLRQAGYRFYTLRQSILEHPRPQGELLAYHLGQHSYFYETCLTPSRQYYKHRNWAWLQRQKEKPLRLLIACAATAILSTNAMMRSNELNISSILNILKALKRGALGQLTPYPETPPPAT